MTLDLDAIEERAKTFVGIPEGRGHLDVLVRDVLALADEVRRLRDGMKAALTWIDTGAPVPEGRLNRVREELLIALARDPAEEEAN